MTAKKQDVVGTDPDDVQRPWDQGEPKTDWSAFPEGYGILLNERLIYPMDLSLWRMKIDRTHQLLVDDYLVAHRSNLKREFHRPKDHPANPILEAAIPAYVAPDPEHGYRLYYHTDGWLLHVAYSSDGVNWSKPALDLYDISTEPESFPGGPNNVILRGAIHGLLHEPQDPDPSQRWKAVILPHRGSGRRVRWPYADVITLTDGSSIGGEEAAQGVLHAVMASPDGLRWSHKADTCIVKGPSEFRAPHRRPVGVGDVLQIRWDPKLNKYIANTKHFIGPDMRLTPVFHTARVQAMCESDDLIHWSSPRVYAYPDGEDAKTPGMWGIYEADGFPYESMWLNCFSITCYHPASKEDRKKRNLLPNRPWLKRNWIRLAGSRDGRQWYYLGDREPFLDLGAEDSWKPHYLRMANLATVGGPVLKGEELWFYYRGMNIDGPKSIWRKAAGVAILRRDGFASLNAGEQPARLITRPLVFEGEGNLYVNADVGKGGYLRASVLGEQGEILQGFTEEQSIAVRRDTTRAKIRWKQCDTLAGLKDRYIRLAFHLKRARLYSFWVE